LSSDQADSELLDSVYEELEVIKKEIQEMHSSVNYKVRGTAVS